MLGLVAAAGGVSLTFPFEKLEEVGALLFGTVNQMGTSLKKINITTPKQLNEPQR